MVSHIRSLIQTNILLKFLSLLFAFCFWLMWSSGQQISVSWNVPLCFFNSDDRRIQAPDSVQITMFGKRKDLLELDPKTIAIHVDAQTLVEGEQLLKPTAEQLLLPLGVQIAQCNSIRTVVEIESET